MNQLLEMQVNVASARPMLASLRQLATSNVLSDLLEIDAQAAYQTALGKLRLHRNRWTAAASN